MNAGTTTQDSTTIEAPQDLPAIRVARDFAATVAQLVRAHTDPDIFAQWVGPDEMRLTIDHWDARTGGSWRYVHSTGGEDYAFHGSFHEVRADRLVQTFTFEGFPDSVSLETMTFEDLGEGRTRLHIQSMFDSYEARDGKLASGMGEGVNAGYAKLDRLLEADVL